ncbi:MAG: hypothetical protein JWR09_2855 [Mucilaginibacter sp.]|nr:hypothetical protein [Mucilaginibacter sp.]
MKILSIDKITKQDVTIPTKFYPTITKNYPIHLKYFKKGQRIISFDNILSTKLGFC